MYKSVRDRGSGERSRCGERGSGSWGLEVMLDIQIGCFAALKSSNWPSNPAQNFENVLRFGRGAVIFSQTYHKYISSLPPSLLRDILPAPLSDSLSLILPSPGL